jgi:hypothetical protein
VIKMNMLDATFIYIAGALKDAGIPYWLEAGSLLGAVREGKRIEYDGDYDIAYPAEYVMQVIDVLEALPYPLGYKQFGHFLIRNTLTDEHYICLVSHAIIRNKMYEVTIPFLFTATRFVHFHKYPPILVKILGHILKRFYIGTRYRDTIDGYRAFIVTQMGDIEVPIPCGYEQNLINHYGENWMKHKMKGEYIDGTAPKNLRERLHDS